MQKNKLITFFVSVITGIIKATPFGHIKTEIENNIQSDKTTDPGQLDRIRLIVWIITTVLFLLKAFNLITFDELFKVLELFTKF
jgi:hypothetical protein